MKKILILSVALFLIGCSAEQRNLNKAKKLVEAYMINNTPSDAEYSPIAYSGLDSIYSNVERDVAISELGERYDAKRDSLQKIASHLIDTDVKAYIKISDEIMGLYDVEREERDAIYADPKYIDEFSGWITSHKFKSQKYDRGYAFGVFMLNKNLTSVENADFFDHDAVETAKWVKDSINKYLIRKDDLSKKEKKELKKWEDYLEFVMK